MTTSATPSPSSDSVTSTRGRWCARSRGRGAPVDVVRVDDPSVRKVYDADALLVRPDLHVAWRGDREADDPELVAATVTGTLDPKG